MVVVGEAGSGEEACAICAERTADVVLMDLRLPGVSGVDAIRKIRATHPDVRFIVLTTYEGDEDLRRALDAGARGYLLKAMSHTDVTAAIRKAHSGARVIPLPAGLSALVIRNVFRDSKDRLWIGTDGQGVARLDGTAIVRYTMKDGLVNDFVRAFCEDREGGIWTGTDSGLSYYARGPSGTSPRQPVSCTAASEACCSIGAAVCGWRPSAG